MLDILRVIHKSRHAIWIIFDTPPPASSRNCCHKILDSPTKAVTSFMDDPLHELLSKLTHSLFSPKTIF